MLTVRETATLLAALQHWQEEMVPHGRAIMRPYFRIVGCDGITPLNRAEVARLLSRLKSHSQSLVT